MEKENKENKAYNFFFILKKKCEDSLLFKVVSKRWMISSLHQEN